MIQRHLPNLKTTLALALAALPLSASAQSYPHLELIESYKVWDQAPHNAFTSLTRFQDKWLLCFREAHQHDKPDAKLDQGKARILVSNDGKNWKSVALLSLGNGQDIRDPKITVLPDQTFMLSAGVAQPPSKDGPGLITYRWLSKDGLSWGEAEKLQPEDQWLWRVTVDPEGTLWSIGYGPMRERPRDTTLYRAENDGKFHFTPWVDPLTPEDETGEATLIFPQHSDHQALALVRQDGEENSARIGVASPSLKTWNFKSTGIRVGGPNLLELPCGAILGGGRLYEPSRMALFWVDYEKGRLREALTLPSALDCSYPGMVLQDDILWVSYYSAHESRQSCIYLAKVRIVCDQEACAAKNQPTGKN